MKSENIVAELEKLKMEFEKILHHLEKNLKFAPPGNIRGSLCHGVSQFYFIEENGSKNGKYISKKKIDFIRKLAQKTYDSKLLAAMKKDLSLIEKFLNQSKFCYESIYEELSPPVRELVEPIFVPSNKFVELWRKVEYERKRFSDELPEFYTALGERVRSKSEILIADALNRFCVPYRYEFPLFLKGIGGDNIKIHPDFCCLNVKNGKEFLWEHFGLMDDGSYASKTARKLNLYQRNGIFPGDKLLMTMETSESPLNSKIVEATIRKFLL